jgi:hypothetical protein
MDAAATIPITTPDGDVVQADFDATTDGKADLHAFNRDFQAGGGVVRPLGPGAMCLDLRGGADSAGRAPARSIEHRFDRRRRAVLG